VEKIAGHGVLDPDSSPRHIEETRSYINDFNAAAASTSTVIELYEKMLALHPNRVNPGSLWATANAVKGNAKAAAEAEHTGALKSETSVQLNLTPSADS
jgi:hypothetical protein